MFMKLLRGVRIPHRKDTADCPPKRIPIPPVVTLPTSMHIGAPAKTIVKVGDLVKVGQRIADADGMISAPIHSSVSGKVQSCGKLLLSNGQISPAIVIETDGLQELSPDLRPPDVSDRDSFLAAVRDSGMVGLGGAGFPTGAKLQVDPARVKTILINGAECEPYITSDTRTMLDHTDLVWIGARLLQTYLQPKQVLICIEKNKPQCIEKFQVLCRDQPDISVVALPARYPQGGEKVLLYSVLGKILPEGKLPIDIGAIVLNCTTAATLARYITTGMPLVEKCITVDGSAVAHPQNVIAPIGAPLQALFDFCGGFRSDPATVFYGGPMMGVSVPNLDYPVLKSTNAVLAFGQRDGIPPDPTPCIKCGRCIEHCPLHLMPAEIERAYRLNKPEELQALKVSLCMRCGCCSYVCPAKRPLVQINKMANLMLRQYLVGQPSEHKQ